MRRLLVFAALSTSLAACSKDDGDAALEDAGDDVASHEGGAKGDASEPEPGDDGGEDPLMDGGGAAGGTDAAMSGDASRPRDAGQDASGLRDAGPSTSLEGGSATSGCAGKAYKLCEDFESASVGALPSGWTAVSAWGGGSAVVSDDQFHSGSKSLKGADTVNGQTRAGKSLSSLGSTASKHWGRVFFKVRSPATFPPMLDGGQWTVFHNTVVGLQGANEWRVVDTIVNPEGKNNFALNIPDDTCCGETQYVYTAYDGKWHCAEWYIDVATVAYRFFYDGKEANLNGAKPNGIQGQQLTQLILGWIGYQTSKMPYNQAWMDDLAIDDNRIGCD